VAACHHTFSEFFLPNKKFEKKILILNFIYLNFNIQKIRLFLTIISVVIQRFCAIQRFLAHCTNHASPLLSSN
jgi:hypothetical protein